MSIDCSEEKSFITKVKGGTPAKWTDTFVAVGTLVYAAIAAATLLFTYKIQSDANLIATQIAGWTYSQANSASRSETFVRRPNLVIKAAAVETVGSRRLLKLRLINIGASSITQFAVFTAASAEQTPTACRADRDRFRQAREAMIVPQQEVLVRTRLPESLSPDDFLLTLYFGTGSEAFDSCARLRIVSNTVDVLEADGLLQGDPSLELTSKVN